jgi:hypothetical protein
MSRGAAKKGEWQSPSSPSYYIEESALKPHAESKREVKSILKKKRTNCRRPEAGYQNQNFAPSGFKWVDIYTAPNI